MSPTVSVTIEPNDKHDRVIGGYADPEPAEEPWEEWPEEHKKAADAYIELVDDAATEPGVIERDDGALEISCPICGRTWSASPDAPDADAARDDLQSRLQAHRPCEEGDTLSWADISPASDPDLLAKIATYFDGINADEPTDLIRAKLRLVNVETYANVQFAAQNELRNE